MVYQFEHHAPVSKVIYIDSRDASQYLTYQNGLPLTSHFQYIFDDAISINSNIDTLISLHSASLPYSFYNMREGINNFLDFRFGFHSSFDTDFTDITIKIPEGNYTIASLLRRLNLDITNALISINGDNSPDNTFYQKVPNPKFNFEYVKWKQKIILSFDSEGTKDLEIMFLFDTGENKERAVRVELGLRVNDTQGFFITLSGDQNRAINPINYSGIHSEVDSEYQYHFMSPNCIDIQNSVRGIYVRTNLTSVSTLDTLTGSYSGILARIPIKVQSGGVVFLKPDNATHKAVIKLHMIKTISFRITDDRNRLLDFNGLNLQLALQFDFVYSKRPIAPLTNIESRLIQHTDDRHLLKKGNPKYQKENKKNKKSEKKNVDK
mgnify:FL=1